MNRDDLIRKLRDLRRLERRITGDPEHAEIWNRDFSLTEGARVRYPFAMLLAFDRASRERAFHDYLFAVWARAMGSTAARPEEDAEVRVYLGLAPEADASEVRRAFREMAMEAHPDRGGDEAVMKKLLEKYRRSSFGSGAEL